MGQWLLNDLLTNPAACLLSGWCMLHAHGAHVARALRLSADLLHTCPLLIALPREHTLRGYFFHDMCMLSDTKHTHILASNLSCGYKVTESTCSSSPRIKNRWLRTWAGHLPQMSLMCIWCRMGSASLHLTDATANNTELYSQLQTLPARFHKLAHQEPAARPCD